MEIISLIRYVAQFFFKRSILITIKILCNYLIFNVLRKDNFENNVKFFNINNKNNLGLSFMLSIVLRLLTYYNVSNVSGVWINDNRSESPTYRNWC